MSLDAVILILIIIVIYIAWRLSRGASPEAFIDYKQALGVDSSAPAYTSGATMRIAETRISDLSGEWRTKFGEDEGKWYARHLIRNPEAARQITNPTYHTATTF